MTEKSKHNASIISFIAFVILFYLVNPGLAMLALFPCIYFRKEEFLKNESVITGYLNSKQFMVFFIVYEFLFVLVLSIYHWEPYFVQRHYHNLSSNAEIRITMTLFFLPFIPYFFNSERKKFKEINKIGSA
jgi:hypothetical protein